jgi:hypothetical protein
MSEISSKTRARWASSSSRLFHTQRAGKRSPFMHEHLIREFPPGVPTHGDNCFELRWLLA